MEELNESRCAARRALTSVKRLRSCPRSSASPPSLWAVTLVLSVLTPECVIQVSDRRLVMQVSGTGKAAFEDDERNKAVLWSARLAFAYSGLADLGDDRRTDLWLAHALAAIVEEARGMPKHLHLDQRHLLERLADRCTEEFRRTSIQSLDSEMRRQAFVGVGWACFNGEEQFSPYLACVSNLYSRGDSVPLPEPADEFSVWVRRLEPSDGGYFYAEGQRLDDQEQAALVQRLGALDAAFPGPEALIEALIEVVREKADVPGSFVGRGLLVNVLPRASIVAGETESMVLLGPPLPDQQTFLYLRSDQGTPGEWYGPVFVDGGVIVQGFTVIELPADSA